MVDTPSLALERVRLEFGHIGGIAHTMLDKLQPAMLSRQPAALEAVSRSLEAAVRAVRDEDETAAEDVIRMKDEIHRLVARALEHQAAMLAAEDSQRLTIFRLEMEAVDKLKRIYALAKRIAKGMLPTAILDKAA